MGGRTRAVRREIRDASRVDKARYISQVRDMWEGVDAGRREFEAMQVEWVEGDTVFAEGLKGVEEKIRCLAEEEGEEAEVEVDFGGNPWLERLYVPGVRDCPAPDPKRVEKRQYSEQMRLLAAELPGVLSEVLDSFSVYGSRFGASESALFCQEDLIEALRRSTYTELKEAEVKILFNRLSVGRSYITKGEIGEILGKWLKTDQAVYSCFAKLVSEPTLIARAKKKALRNVRPTIVSAKDVETVMNSGDTTRSAFATHLHTYLPPFSKLKLFEFVAHLRKTPKILTACAGTILESAARGVP